MSDNHVEPQSITEEACVATPKTAYTIVESEQFQAKYAGFWIRLWAYLIDFVIIGAVSGIIIKPIFRVVGIEITSPSFLLFSPYKVTFLILLLLYFTLMTKLLQQTVGKMIMAIKVVPSNGGDLTWGTVIIRETIGRFISKTLTVPYLLAIFMPRKEALHDIFADTNVVHEQAYEKIITEKRVRRLDGHQLPEGSNL